MDRVKIATLNLNFFYPLPLALSLIIFRRLLDKFCYEPIGITCGIIPSRMTKKQKSTVFSKDLNLSSWISPAQVFNLIKYLDFSGKLDGKHKTEKLAKFCRSAWNFTHFTYAFLHGLGILWTKSWFWNIKECWTDFYHQKIPDDIWFYYVVNLTYYWSLLITLLIGRRGKDFHENVIHHSVAILLIYISLTMNAFRIGTIVLVVLGVGDIFLESAKMAKYLNYTKSCNTFFAFFAAVWVISRLGFFPFWILNSTLFGVPKTLEVNLGYYTLNCLLLLLMMLNFFWTIMIFKVLRKAIVQGKVEDHRSDSDSES